MNLEKARKVEAQPDYEKTVPEDVRAANEEKVCPLPTGFCSERVVVVVADWRFCVAETVRDRGRKLGAVDSDVREAQVNVLDVSRERRGACGL